jgi:hypothetical protein
MEYFIKANNETEFWEKLIEAGVAREADMPVPEGAEPVKVKGVVGGFDLDVIGIIYVPTSEMEDQNGLPVPVMEALPGFHANLRGALSEEQQTQLADILIEKPTSPVRVWA